MKKTFFNRFICVLLSCLLLQSITVFAVGLVQESENFQQQTQQNNEVLSRMLVLHYSGNEYKETLSHLENSLVASKEIESLDIASGFSAEDLAKYDCVYIDGTVFNASNMQYINSAVEQYVFNGGSIFVPNKSVDFFSHELLGISKTVKLESVPCNLVNMAVGTDMEMIGELVCDFEKLYKGYTDYDYFSKLDYGYGFVTSTAKPIVCDENDTCIYALNNYGDGYVFLTNPLLPNNLNVNSFERYQTYFDQRPFAASSAGANSLIKGYFASFVAKQKHGFSLERTFGSYGTQPIAWQLHYEEITGIENNASIIFSEICKKYNQIPSFTLIRNTYKWFSRYESISYLDINNNICTVDFNEGAYSNGTHVIADNSNLYTVEIENTGSYFEDLPSAKQRLFPCIYDINGDGLMDIICGSSDGRLYVFETRALDGRWVCENYYMIKDANGNDIDVGSYSAPVLLDFDGDGRCDIISGDAQGNVLFIKNAGDGVYEKPSVVINIGATESMLTLGDIDNDSVNELVVGSCEGKIYSYEIENGYLTSQKLLVHSSDETFLSPCVYDINNDGKQDILAGTYHGYVRRYVANAQGFANGGYIMANEPNYKGNYRVKFGNNATPRFFDADGDSADELVCGSYEYGLNVPIDSPYFQFKQELTQQINYILKNNFYLGVHFYTNAHATQKREQAELLLHKNAFAAYGINTDRVGVNQHTWYTSSNSNLQTLESVKQAGLLWDSGWQSASSSTAPQSSTENVLGFPGFINKDSSMLAFNTGTLLYLDDSITDITAKYSLPMSIYYHCDFAYENPDAAENDVKHVADYVKRNGMSFVKEDQFAKMTAASVNLNIHVKFNDDGSFTLYPTNKNENFPMFDETYAKTVGVRMEVSKGDSIDNYTSDAEFYFTKKNALTFTLNKNVTVEKAAFDDNNATKSHIASFNTPAKVMYGDGMAVVSFDDNSYVQVTVEGKAECSSKSVSSEYDGKYTVFYGFGIKNMNIVFK